MEADLAGADPVVCREWAEGRSASLRAGIEALPDADAFVVTLGDQPLVTADVVRRIAEEEGTCRAAYDGRPGHPVRLTPRRRRAGTRPARRSRRPGRPRRRATGGMRRPELAGRRGHRRRPGGPDAMKLEQSFSVAAPLDAVWAALTDIERVAPCLPGAEARASDEEGVYEGTFSVKLGPTTASYQGSLRMQDLDEAGHVATMRAEGRDRRGQGGAKATIVSSLSEPGRAHPRRRRHGLPDHGPPRALRPRRDDRGRLGEAARALRRVPAGAAGGRRRRRRRARCGRAPAGRRGRDDAAAARARAAARRGPPTPPPPPPPPSPAAGRRPRRRRRPRSEPLDAGSILGSVVKDRAKDAGPLLVLAFLLGLLVGRAGR